MSAGVGLLLEKGRGSFGGKESRAERGRQPIPNSITFLQTNCQGKV